jgi:hypothetical protein
MRSSRRRASSIRRSSILPGCLLGSTSQTTLEALGASYPRLRPSLGLYGATCPRPAATGRGTHRRASRQRRSASAAAAAGSRRRQLSAAAPRLAPATAATPVKSNRHPGASPSGLARIGSRPVSRRRWGILRTCTKKPARNSFRVSLRTFPQAIAIGGRWYERC